MANKTNEPYSIPCIDCVHMGAGVYCFAFPNGSGIPKEILQGLNDHTQPYPGDHGLQYSPIGGYSEDNQ